MRVKTLVLLAFLGLAASCRDDSGQRLFELSGRIFLFNYRVATATYVVTLRPTGTVPQGLTAIGSFEDPAGGPVIVVEQKVYPALGKVTLESPPLDCLVKDRTYKAAISIRDSAGRILQTIETDVLSTLDQSVLPDRPLVIGPVYAPNPELAGRPDGHLPGGRKACTG